KVPVTSTPNIFSYRSHIFAKNPALVQRYIKATKADVGGVGGHVVAADEVKSTIAKFVLDNNGYRGEPIFTSLIVTHTGDDCAVTGIMSESVDMSVVDELMWDALQEGATKAAELGLYGPGQELVADAFTGNLRGAGPATVVLPFPVRKDNPSQTVLVCFAAKTGPMPFDHYATGASILPRPDTGMITGLSDRPSSCTTSRPMRASPTAARAARCSWPSLRATGRRPARSPHRGPPRRWWPATAAAATTCTSCRCRSTRRRPTGRVRSCRPSRSPAISTRVGSVPSRTSSR